MAMAKVLEMERELDRRHRNTMSSGMSLGFGLEETRTGRGIGLNRRNCMLGTECTTTRSQWTITLREMLKV